MVVVEKNGGRDDQRKSFIVTNYLLITVVKRKLNTPLNHRGWETLD